MPSTRVPSHDMPGPADAATRGPSQRRAAAASGIATGAPADRQQAGAGNAVMALQRSAGNAAVASLVSPSRPLQRDVQIGEMTSSTSVADPGTPLSPEIAVAIPAIVEAVRAQAAPGSAAASGAAAGPSDAQAPVGTAAGVPSPVTSDGASTTISGAVVNIDAPMTTTQGVLQADTLVAQNVIASTYTPGAGNVM